MVGEGLPVRADGLIDLKQAADWRKARPGSGGRKRGRKSRNGSTGNVYSGTDGKLQVRKPASRSESEGLPGVPQRLDATDQAEIQRPIGQRKDEVEGPQSHPLADKAGSDQATAVRGMRGGEGGGSSPMLSESVRSGVALSDVSPEDAFDPEPVEAADYAKARAEREVSHAALKKLDLKTRLGELVERTDVEKAASDTARRLRESLLGIPDRIAAQVAAEPDQRVVHDMITSEIETTLEALADGIGG
jgi:hypothetical protein